MSDKRALVVDDSKVGRLTMKKKLEAIGVGVDLVESGEEALDYLGRSRPDVIFMDHMMPGDDGFVVTQKIRANPATQGIPVIIISGNDDEDFVQQARAHGAINAIRKPPEDGILEGILGSLPQLAAAAAAPGAAMEAAPQPVTVERRKVPFMDQAAVSAYVERVLGEVIDHLHSDLLGELMTQVEAGLEKERQAVKAWSDRLSEQMEQTAAGQGDLRQGAEALAALRQHLGALEQRLAPLESQAGREPDLEALQDRILARVEERLTSRLAELQEGGEPQEAALEGLRQEVLAGVGDQLVQAEQRVGGLASRLDGLAVDLKRLSDDAQSASAGRDERIAAMEERLASIGATEPAPDMDALLAAVDTHIAPQLSDVRNELLARLEERPKAPTEEALHERLSGPLQAQQDALRSELEAMRNQVQAAAQVKDAVEAALSAQGERLQAKIDEVRDGLAATYGQEREQLSSGLEAQLGRLEASEDNWARRFQALEERLDEMAQGGGDAEAQRAQDMERLLTAMDERIAPRLEGMRSEFQALIADRPPMPTEELVRESLSGPLQEQQDALRAELDELRSLVQATTQVKASLEGELVSLDERLQGRLDEVQEGLVARFEQERGQLAASDEGWGRRFQALEDRLHEMTQAGTDEAVQRVLEQRIAHMREVIGEVLQPDYPGRRTWADETSAPVEGGRLLKEIEAEVSDLRERMDETHLRHLITEAVGSARPDSETDRDQVERMKAEVARVEGKMKSLTVMLAVGGVALLAAVVLVALLR